MANGNIIVTSAFVTSWIDLLIHCILILQNTQLKDATGMNIVAGTWTGTAFPVSFKISYSASKVISI